MSAGENNKMQNLSFAAMLPYKLKTQYVHCRLFATYFVLLWRNPAEMSTWSISLWQLKAVSTIIKPMQIQVLACGGLKWNGTFKGNICYAL